MDTIILDHAGPSAQKARSAVSHDLDADEIQWNLTPLPDSGEWWLPDLATARRRIIDLEHDVLIYRMWFRASLHALHNLTLERDRLRRSVRELRESLRRYSRPMSRAE